MPNPSSSQPAAAAAAVAAAANPCQRSEHRRSNFPYVEVAQPNSGYDTTWMPPWSADASGKVHEVSGWGAEARWLYTPPWGGSP